MEGRLEACLHGGGVTQIGEATKRTKGLINCLKDKRQNALTKSIQTLTAKHKCKVNQYRNELHHLITITKKKTDTTKQKRREKQTSDFFLSSY